MRGEGPSWVLLLPSLSDSLPITPAMHPLGEKHQSLFQHNPLGYILGYGLLFPSNPICLPCSRKASSFLVDLGCPFLFSQGYLHLLLFLPVIFLEDKTHHLKYTVLWFYIHNVYLFPEHSLPPENSFVITINGLYLFKIVNHYIVSLKHVILYIRFISIKKKETL